jgi:hypothetical protein
MTEIERDTQAHAIAIAKLRIAERSGNAEAIQTAVRAALVTESNLGNTERQAGIYTQRRSLTQLRTLQVEPMGLGDIRDEECVVRFTWA